MKFFLSSLLILIAVVPLRLNGQGCSDAGFCSIGDLKTQLTQTDANHKNAIAPGASLGIGLEGTLVLTPYLEYSRKLSERAVLNAKLTAVYATGDLGSNFDIGDLFFSGSYVVAQKEKLTASVLAGIKVPLNYSNNKNADGQPLPLDYQSSIGTYDLILGFRAAIKKITLSAGAQLPLKQVNENTFFPELYTDSAAYNYSPTNDFERKSDLLFRASYNIAFEKSSILLQPNLLAIYHLGNDSYFDLSGTRVTIENSQGLTLNAGATITKSFKNASALEILIAAPLVVREVRPDGLTRSFVLNLQYKIPF